MSALSIMILYRLYNRRELLLTLMVGSSKAGTFFFGFSIQIMYGLPASRAQSCVPTAIIMIYRNEFV